MALATQVLLTLLVLVAGYFDIRFRRIPNWLVFPAVLTGIALNSFLFEWAGLKASLLGIGFAALVYFPMYLLRGMGAGDVKLMMAVGSLVGPGSWFGILIFTGIAGGIIAVILVVSRGRLRHTFWNVGFLISRVMRFQAPYATNPELDVRSGQGIRLPHGAVIALGVMAFLAAIKIFPPA
jgi:prepilin peptidase CpaA